MWRCSRSEQRLTRLGLSFVIGGAIGNLIDRIAVGYVLDFVDFYWGGWHFWAFNVADAAIHIGVALMILDMLGVGRSTVYPELFSLGPVTVYSYGVLLAASYLLGLRLAMSRARRAASTATACSTSASTSSLPRWSARSCCCSSWISISSAARRRTCSRWSASGGVFYGGLMLAVAVAFWYINKHRMPFWTTCDVFAPAIALGHVTGRLGCMAAGCCYGRPTDVPWAHHLHEPAGRRERRHAARHPAAPDAALRGRRRAADSGPAACDRDAAAARSPAGRSGPTCCSTPISRYIIEFYRGDPRGMVLRHVHVAVHLAHPGAAQPGDAGLAARTPPETPQEMRGRRKAAAEAESSTVGSRLWASISSSRSDSEGQRLDRFLVSVLAELFTLADPEADHRGHVTVTARRRARRRRGPTCSVHEGDRVVVDAPERGAVGSHRRSAASRHPLSGRRPCGREQTSGHGRSPGAGHARARS